jgi:hypothetical protein
MSLEYYLFCRKEYHSIISYLEEIVNRYELISDVTNSEPELEPEYYEIFKPEYNKKFFIDKQKYVKQIKKICDRKILELCNHEYIDDYIDITPDRSKKITYCKICEHTIE